MNQTNFSLQNWTRPALLLTAMGASLLAGCGGGGSGNGSTTFGGTTGGSTGTTGTGTTGTVTPADASVIGKVVDTGGNPIPGATVIPDNGGAIATTFSQGSYRIDGLTAGIHRLTAAVTRSGVSYTGSTEVSAQSQSVASNANIEMSAATQQATVAGTVADTSGNPLSGARVFFSVPNGSGMSSLVAFTDINGVYSLQNVPILTIGGASAPVVASVLGYENASSSVSALQSGEVRTVNFQLAPSSDGSVVTPTNLSVQAFTQPGTAATAQVVRRVQVSGASAVYESLRRLLSPHYARAVAGRHLAARIQHLKLAPRDSVFGQYAIETDLSFDNAEPSSLSGFTIYRSFGTAPPVQTRADAYDFLQDPLANFYSDIDPSYSPSEQVNFALSATNTDRAEGSLSTPASVVPLDLLTLSQPQAGASVTDMPTFAWNSISNAVGYRLFIYSQFPSINSSGVLAFDSGATLIPATTTTVALTRPLPRGQDYYGVVVGVNADASALTLSQITRFHVP